MKRKSLLALGLLTCMLILSGVFIIESLNKVYFVEKLSYERMRMVNRYDRVLYHIKDTQAELYSLAANFSENLDPLDDDLLQAKQLLSVSIGEYAGYVENNGCKYCHSVKGAGAEQKKVTERITYHDETLKDILARVMRYEEKVKRVVNSKPHERTLSLIKEAARVGEDVIDRIHNVKNAAMIMTEGLEEFQEDLLRRSMYSIVLSIIASIVLAVIIVIVLIKSFTKPVGMLIEGMERVSSGDLNSRISITSRDEIGFLATTFNKMTETLNEVTTQNVMLLKEQMDLNTDLDQRVREATGELIAAQERILRNETLSAVGTFASGVAHELATPLSSLMTYFQMVKGRIHEQDGLAVDIGIIESEIGRCIGILREMLFFAKAPEKEKEMTDINVLLRELLALIRYQPEYKKTIRIKEELDPGIPMIMAAMGQLRQVFLNICVNALQSMPQGGILTVSTSLTRDRERVVISISDTGCGIPEDKVKKIFQPFYTGRTSGIGLGLSICYGIIKDHGGDIEVKSEVGKGTTFSIYLPVA